MIEGLIGAVLGFVLGYLVRRNNPKGIGNTEQFIQYIDDVVEEKVQRKIKDLKK
jgi:hypothetical protein